jgi:hypothetical protein
MLEHPKENRRKELLNKINNKIEDLHYVPP